MCLRRARRKLVSTGPRRRALLRRLRYLGRHRPRGAVRLLFDVQPITAKAYGGRRYTTAGRLVLPRAHKTRGRFYLFCCYPVGRARVRWAFYPGKGSQFVCRFLRRVRRWYPRSKVWVALDRDSAHPRKCRQTRRVMRALKLRWVSLPKGSPDDNPVGTIFSAVQQRILGHSNDPGPQATQRRSSAPRRGRNRRKGRRIRIGYLDDSHKS